MSASGTRPLIACVDSSEDVANLLADYLRLEGFRTVAHTTPIRWGAEPVISFIAELRPDACVFTVSLPYAESWAEFQALRAAVPHVPFVLTTTNRRALEEAVGPVDSIELLGKPYDLDEVCQAVRRALAGRTARSRLT
jgi:DNA-binding response OmpR family regulator